MLVIPVQSAPKYNRALYDNRMKRMQPWDNPCGSETIENVYPIDYTDRNMTEDFEGFASPAITMMMQSLDHGRSFSELFVSTQIIYVKVIFSIFFIIIIIKNPQDLFLINFLAIIVLNSSLFTLRKKLNFLNMQ